MVSLYDAMTTWKNNYNGNFSLIVFNRITVSRMCVPWWVLVPDRNVLSAVNHILLISLSFCGRVHSIFSVRNDCWVYMSNWEVLSNLELLFMVQLLDSSFFLFFFSFSYYMQSVNFICCMKIMYDVHVRLAFFIWPWPHFSLLFLLFSAKFLWFGLFSINYK